jgi:ribosomal protein L30/L7E
MHLYKVQPLWIELQSINNMNEYEITNQIWNMIDKIKFTIKFETS